MHSDWSTFITTYANASPDVKRLIDSAVIPDFVGDLIAKYDFPEKSTPILIAQVSDLVLDLTSVTELADRIRNEHRLPGYAAEPLANDLTKFTTTASAERSPTQTTATETYITPEQDKSAVVTDSQEEQATRPPTEINSQQYQQPASTPPAAPVPQADTPVSDTLMPERRPAGREIPLMDDGPVAHIPYAQPATPQPQAPEPQKQSSFEPEPTPQPQYQFTPQNLPIHQDPPPVAPATSANAPQQVPPAPEEPPQPAAPDMSQITPLRTMRSDADRIHGYGAYRKKYPEPTDQGGDNDQRSRSLADLPQYRDEGGS